MRRASCVISSTRRSPPASSGAASAPGGREALSLIWRYILITNPSAGPDAVVAQLLDVVGVEHTEAIMTVGEQLIERGRKDGLEKGRKEGQERSLLRLLRARLGAVPEVAVARIRAADSSRLDAWFDRAVTAATLDDVFEGDAGVTAAG